MHAPSGFHTLTGPIPPTYLERLLTALQAVNQAVALEDDPQVLAQAVCRCLREKGVFSRCALVFLDEEKRPSALAREGFPGSLDPRTETPDAPLEWPPCFVQAQESHPWKTICPPKKRCSACPFADEECDSCDLVVSLEPEGGVTGFLAANFLPETPWETPLAMLIGELARSRLTAFHSRMERRKSQKAWQELDEKERFLKTLFRALPVGVGVISDRRFTFVNERLCRMLGYGKEELVGQSSLCCYADEAEFERAGKTIYKHIQEKGTGMTRTRGKRRDGTIFHALLAYAPMDRQHPHQNVVFSVLDITRYTEALERAQQLEHSLLRAQKMEALGTLAGGIAHDFNNILSAIMGYADLVLLDCPPEGELCRNAEQIRKAGMRAKDLVQQILSISRQHPGETERLWIVPLVKEVIKFMRAALPPTIAIEQDLQDRDACVEADPTEIHQVLLNLCTNAGHAMRKTGGRLRLSVRSTQVDHQVPVAISTLNPGSYVEIRVEDTGEGMTKHVLERAFDPYFTTKSPGEGTGLGLASVQTIVRKHGGAIDVASQPGEGTVFTVYLPRKEKAELDRDEAEKPVLPHGKERIVLVDDEPEFLDMARQVLEKLGYAVRAFELPEPCLQAILEGPDNVDLLVTDLLMPEMTGDRLALEVNQQFPDLPILLITGHLEEINMQEMRRIGIHSVLRKPFTTEELAFAVRKTLDACTKAQLKQKAEGNGPPALSQNGSKQKADPKGIGFLFDRFLVGRAGLEPATLCLKGRYSTN